MLTGSQKEALFVAVHRAIEQAAVRAASTLSGSQPYELAYPPNAGLTSAERHALQAVTAKPELASAVRKVVADAAAAPLFELFSFLDGVADPSGLREPWFGATIEPAAESGVDTTLHDDLVETYWLWRRNRPDPGWTLDTFQGA